MIRCGVDIVVAPLHTYDTLIDLIQGEDEVVSRATAEGYNIPSTSTPIIPDAFRYGETIILLII